MSDIFLSYRRDDSANVTGRIFDHLKERFGALALFKDVDSIPLGADFRLEIDRALSKCKVAIVIIGRGWLIATDHTGRRRLDDPEDYVRIEIESALSKGIPVIPVVVEGAALPSEKNLPPTIGQLAYRNATPIRSDPDFHSDIKRLSDQLAKQLGQPSLSLPHFFVGYKATIIVSLISAIAIFSIAVVFNPPSKPKLPPKALSQTELLQQLLAYNFQVNQKDLNDPLILGVEVEVTRDESGQNVNISFQFQGDVMLNQSCVPISGKYVARAEVKGDGVQVISDSLEGRMQARPVEQEFRNRWAKDFARRIEGTTANDKLPADNPSEVALINYRRLLEGSLK